MLKHFLLDTPRGKLIMVHYNYWFFRIRSWFVSDMDLIRKKYFKSFGKYPDLDNPVTLNEKINWLKLYDRTPLHTQCADKYEVRSYVKEKIGDQYLIPLLFHSTKLKEVVPENFPDNVPFIIKTNHDSGGGIFVRNKSDIDWKEARANLKLRLLSNYYYRSGEWQYKNIKICILAEELLMDENGGIPFDYKLHCFNGKVETIHVDLDRGTANQCRNWYSRTWEREAFRWSSPLKTGNGYSDPSSKDVDKPMLLDKMIALSEKLSEAFDYCRVDWYEVNGKLYFGEITFHHDGGYQPILPPEWDKKLGEKAILNTKK